MVFGLVTSDKGMASLSAGLLMFRKCDGEVQVLLVHPGGPFWAKKDAGAWTIPKGEVQPGEEPLDAARREFLEETGIRPESAFIPLEPIKQRGGKTVRAWAFEGNCDAASIRSNTFTMEWPPHSAKHQEFPEVDRAEWFGLDEARQRLNPAQCSFIDQLSRILAG